MAVVLSCIDSRTPTELIFDLGIGDVFSIRIAGNVAREKVLASMEYASIVAGARLVVVLGHTRCGAVTTAVDLRRKGQRAIDATGCEHIDVLVDEIALSIDGEPPLAADASEQALHEYADRIARKNVRRTMKVIIGQSRCLDRAVREGKVAIVGGVYDVVTGEVDFFATEGSIDDAVLESGDGPDLQPRPVAALPQARLPAEAASLPDRSLTGGESAKPA
jgi:carbonic anhydrase/SulP family sulfate permease